MRINSKQSQFDWNIDVLLQYAVHNVKVFAAFCKKYANA